MKKLCRKQIKKNIRKFIKIFVIQLIILSFAFVLYNVSKPHDPAELTTVFVTVESTDLYTNYSKNSIFVVKSNSTRYFFSSRRQGELSNYELYEEISPGDYLSITYYKFNNKFWVIDSRNDTKIYRSLDVANKELQQGLKSSIAFIVFVEIVYLILVILYLKIIIKPYHRKKKTHKKT